MKGTTHLMKHGLAGILAAVLVSIPMAAMAFTEGPVVKPQMLYKALVDRVHQKYALVAKKMPKPLVKEVKKARLLALNSAIDAKIAQLDSDENAVQLIQNEAKVSAREELVRMKNDLTMNVLGMTSGELDAMADVLSSNRMYADEMLSYSAAFTRTEKASVLVRVLNKDLDQLQSMLVKKTSRMGKSALKADLAKSKAFYNLKKSSDQKGYGSDDVEEVLLYAGIAVASLGLVTWGVASIVYGGRFSDARTEREERFDALRQQLETHYNNLSASLTLEESNFLKNNGYVYMQCGQYTKPDSILCNRYDYKLFSGSQFCTTMCWKNVATGKETLHSQPSCTSPFIPVDCYDPNEYTAGYNSGYNDGYDDGYWDGDEDGWNDGANDGDDAGYDDGYSDGYDDGYDDGFTDGYNTYFSGKSLLKGKAPMKSKNYGKGYEDGLRDANILFKAA